MPVLFHIVMMLSLSSPFLTTRLISKKTCEGDFIYIVCRASRQKSSFIATSFNMKDTVISHVGLGIMEDRRLNIYHVEDKIGNALVVSNLEQFINPAIFYFSVYAIRVSKKEIRKLPVILHSIKAIKFDTDFLLDNHELYCSEFCLKVLTELNPGKFSFKPLTKHLSHPFARSYLGRDNLSYIPVDFFLAYQGIVKIYEQRFSAGENPPFLE